MLRSKLLRVASPAAVLAALALALAGPARAQGEEEKYKNLKVLPKDISHAELRGVMSAFTRALGVRCVYCHVGQEGKPIRDEDFQKDDKLTKTKARAMMVMVHDINENYLAKIDSRAEPPVKVECFTCHRGGQLPRTLQDVLLTAYDSGGLDSTEARYNGLRDHYYGRATYDFGDVPLGDVSQKLRMEGHDDDALAVAKLNVDMNPKSAFAKRQHANTTLVLAYRNGAPAGATAYADLKTQYGPTVVNEDMMVNVGYEMLGEKHADTAIEVFKAVVAANPNSANGYDSLGEAYLAHGDKKLARAAYLQSLKLDPTNDNAKAKLDEIAGKKAKK
jgi:tetratricopeptide (TPR) repeat protein